MQELTQHGMARLQQNLIDVIKEAQAKVGYRKEAIRLYYPLRTINHFFDGVTLVRTPDCTIEQVRALFLETSPKVHFEKIPDNEEFEYLIYFEDASIDPYYYCFNKEFGMLSYHRFLPEDYADVTK